MSKNKPEQEWNHVITITPEAAKKLGVEDIVTKQTEEQVCRCDEILGAIYRRPDCKKHNTTPLLDTEAWEDKFDEEFVITNPRNESDEGWLTGVLPPIVKSFIRALLKNKESSTLQAVREKVKELKKVPAVESWDNRFTDADEVMEYNSALDDVLKLIEE